VTLEVGGVRAIVWSRADRPARIVVDYSFDESMRDARRIVGVAAMESSDFTARADLTGLPANRVVHYRVQFQDLVDYKVYSEPVAGRLVTPPSDKRAVTFAFSGDEAGQGWGINEAWGGYRIYESMRRFHPDFFIHSGDQIYADGPIVAEVKLDDGSIWKNVTTASKSKVAETLDEYRGNFAYNLLDINKRRFASEVPFLVQWDDHETRNNWYPQQTLGDPRYTVRSAALLSARARQAMLEYNPFRFDPADLERIYRAFSYGPSLVARAVVELQDALVGLRHGPQLEYLPGALARVDGRRERQGTPGRGDRRLGESVVDHMAVGVPEVNHGIGPRHSPLWQSAQHQSGACILLADNSLKERPYQPTY
jgi:alkaline phosphatase D